MRWRGTILLSTCARGALLAMLSLACGMGNGPRPGGPFTASSDPAPAPVGFYVCAPVTLPEYVFSLSAVSDTSVWYATNRGVYRFDGKTARRHLEASRFASSFVEVFLVQALADDDVWVLGHDASTWEKTMYRFDGKSWSRVPFPQTDADPAGDLTLFRFRIARDSAGLFGAAVGEDGLYYTFDGVTWSRKPSFTSYSLRTLEILNRKDMWAAGRNGALYHFDGEGWTAGSVEGSRFEDYILEASFSSPTEGWAVSSNTILRYAAGTWTRQDSPDGTVPRTVRAAPGGGAWMFMDNGSILLHDGKTRHTAAKLPAQFGYTAVGLVAAGQAGQYRLFAASTAGIVTNAWGRIATFNDVSPRVNIHLQGLEPSVADFDGNGSEDLFIAADGSYPDRLYANRGDAFYTETTDRLHPPGRSIASRTTLADIDNNGHTDILSQRGQVDNLWYRNLGSWEFEEAAGPVSRPDASNYSRMEASDLDLDGDLDLVLMPATELRRDASAVVYYNDGVGRYPDSTVLAFRRASGASPTGLVVADLDGDGRDDIFRYNSRDRAELYINREAKTDAGPGARPGFAEAARSAGLDLAGDSAGEPFVTWAGAIDLNLDGALDLFAVHRRGIGVFMMNDGRGHFTPGVEIAFDAGGENPAAAFSDIDCDGDADLFLHDRFYENRGGTFAEYPQAGFRRQGSVTFTDIDGDGDEDVVFSTIREARSLSVLENGVNPDRVLVLRLHATKNNSSGIGAAVRLWRWGGSGDGGRELAAFTEVRSPRALRFALDPSSRYDVEVRFPGGIVREHTGVASGTLEIREFGAVEGVIRDFYYSLRRSVVLADLSGEILRLCLLAAILAAALVYATRRLGTSGRANAVFGAAVVAAYLLAVHGTIRNGPAVSMTVPAGGALAAAAGWIFTRERIERRRRARRISHYLLGEEIGGGGMGKVHAAADTLTGGRVAIKVLNEGLLGDAENRKRLIAEGHLLSSLNHPNILRVYEVGEHLGQGFIAMEYMPGGTLQDRVARGPLAPPEAKRIALEICSGLEEIHARGVIHRDLKSGNIMFGSDDRVRIMDFGLSKSPLVTTMTTLGTILGTLGYVSPEQVTNISVDRRADLFSFGVLLYEMLTGRLPFKGENEMAVIHAIFNVEPSAPSSLNPAVPPRLDAVVMRCLRKNPDERYASAAELRVDLDGDYW